ncbi:MAG: hypothetical protein K940chlam8_00528 [Chlamydiae bacterium]|nr:hypothetical protein [Chlamydiota bacterium]
MSVTLVEKNIELPQTKDIYDCLAHVKKLEDVDQTTQEIVLQIKQAMHQDLFLKVVLKRLFETLKTGQLSSDHMVFYEEMTYLAKQQKRLGFNLKSLFEELENMKFANGYFKADLSYQKELLKNAHFKPAFTIRRLNNSEKEKFINVMKITHLAFEGRILKKDETDQETKEIKPHQKDTVNQEDKQEAFLPLNQTLYVVETVAKEIIGTMLVSSKLDWKNKKVDYYIEVVARDPRFSGCRIGQSLIEHLIVKRPQSELSLTVTSFHNKRAIDVYERLGFHFVKDNKTDMVRVPESKTMIAQKH